MSELPTAVRIPLSGRNGYGKFLLVDADLAAQLTKTIYLNKQGYAFFNRYIPKELRQTIRPNGQTKFKQILVHRFVLEASPGQIVDHKNLDKLDCQRGNLRLATRATNVYNRGKRTGTSSRFLGVTRVKKTGRWKATIKQFGITHYLGTFDHEEDAALTYDHAAREHFGEFAVVNQP